mgnify:CR=1 FL=1
MSTRIWRARDVKKCIITPSDLDNKYSRGVLGVITGSARFPGAAVLTSASASATGVGMIRFHSNSGLAHLVLHSNPEVVVQPGPVNAWLAGSGIESKRYSDFTTWLRHRWFTLIKNQSVPTILDAGALHLAGKFSQPTLITPHAGELSRLLISRGLDVTSEAIEGDPKKWAVAASELLGVVVLLKGSQTVVADGESLIELTKSSPWLATAGSGDVLAGIIGALAATNYIEILNDRNRLSEIAASAAYIHNSAALLASRDAPISATKIIEFIPDAIRKIL